MRLPLRVSDLSALKDMNIVDEDAGDQGQELRQAPQRRIGFMR
jgi:hypothetical protein